MNDLRGAKEELNFMVASLPTLEIFNSAQSKLN